MRKPGKHIFLQFQRDLSQESFSQLFDFYYGRLRSFATTIVTSKLLAEEVVMDVFVKLWEKKISLNRIDNIETYLFISVRNAAINLIKRENSRVFDLIEDSEVKLTSYNPSSDNELIEKEMFVVLNNAVEELPSKCKVIFKLIREDGLNRNEVAQILDISVKTVDNQVAIAVRKIAEKLNIDLENPRNSVILMNFLLAVQPDQ